MKTFEVTWRIDVDADNEVDAAHQAWKLLRGKGSIANVFEVRHGPSADAKTIDLSLELTQAELYKETPPTYMTTPIVDLHGAKTFLWRLEEAGQLYHLDDDPADVINAGYGQRLFTDIEADAVRERVKEVRAAFGDGDPFEFMHDEIYKLPKFEDPT